MLTTRKVLPLGSPMLHTYNWHANLLSILRQDERTMPWIFSNFIQIHCLDNSSLDTYYDFYDNPHLLPHRACPWIHVQTIKRELLWSLGVDPVEFLVTSIRQDNYAYAFADMFAIPASEHGGVRHWRHELLVYGFDEETKTFEVADFFHNKYGSRTITFDQMREAIQSEAGPFEWSVPFNGIELWSIRDDARFRFDLGRVAEQLRDYLEGRNSSERFGGYYNAHEGYEFGINVYRKLFFYLDKLRKREAAFDDIRPFHLLLEHKALMVQRIRWMGEQGFLQQAAQWEERFRPIEEAFSAMRNMALRYFKLRHAGDLSRISQCLESIIPIERQVLGELLEQLEKSLYRRRSAVIMEPAVSFG